ncbi:MAG TPA: LytTR family DNA-binding domain-containing protein [Polaromonas sp.]|uniref:LytR/AlgR family response regulator transcription factor n=1 Tax=Polaromonas sp. TaxID=1869339 RepID=UPI002D70238D|nr:LytTR family DNA-binding domain-containing protein [Polaromonas sp.]HYW56528.1 LytTR family DNA-binding domain-containing protein [Polaromonas sp.]
MSQHPATALIAEDEPLLAQSLQAELAQAWPALRVLATVGDGESAVVQALKLRPDVLFFDIRMPGQSGLEAAAELVDEWPQELPFPALVFVTAYDQYAVQAFEAQAIDYLLKPVQTDRLQKTVKKVQLALAARAQAAINSEAPAVTQSLALDPVLSQLRHLLADTRSAPPATGPLKVLQVSVGSSIRMVPVGDVVYFEAADKYIRVLTAQHEYLVRTPLKELLPQLDAHSFLQIHRGTVVHAESIDAVHRDESGKLTLSLRKRPEKLAISRMYSHQFRAM